MYEPVCRSQGFRNVIFTISTICELPRGSSHASSHFPEVWIGIIKVEKLMRGEETFNTFVRTSRGNKLVPDTIKARGSHRIRAVREVILITHYICLENWKWILTGNKPQLYTRNKHCLRFRESRIWGRWSFIVLNGLPIWNEWQPTRGGEGQGLTP